MQKFKVLVSNKVDTIGLFPSGISVVQIEKFLCGIFGDKFKGLRRIETVSGPLGEVDWIVDCWEQLRKNGGLVEYFYVRVAAGSNYVAVFPKNSTVLMRESAMIRKHGTNFSSMERCDIAFFEEKATVDYVEVK